MGITDSIYREGASPNTRLLNSMKVKVFSYDDTGNLTQIGLIQTFSPGHTRTLTSVRGIGFGDQIAEISVGATELSASCEVFGMYLKGIQQVFGYKSDSAGIVRSLKHHRWPFDIVEEIVVPQFLRGQNTPGLRNGTVTYTIYEGCWMSNYTHSYSAGDVNVTESAEMQVTDVSDGLTNYTDLITENHYSTLERKSVIFGGYTPVPNIQV